MNLKKQVRLLLITLTALAGCHSNGTSTPVSNGNMFEAQNTNRNFVRQPTNKKELPVSSDQSRLAPIPLIGCWTGMRGGRLKITKDKIYDLGSNEESSYTQFKPGQKPREGLQTGESYVIEADDDFPKSFLAKFIEFSFNSDGTVGIAAFLSYDDYLKDHFIGAGLFEKIDC